MSEENQNDEPSEEHYDLGCEKWKAERFDAIAQRVHDRNFDAQQSASEAAINHANFALRTLVIINGGAAVALLAFIGSLVSNTDGQFSSKLSAISEPLVSFSWGVASATLAIAFAYFSTYTAAMAIKEADLLWVHPWIKETCTSKRWERFSNVFQIAATIVAFISLYFFITGMLDAREAIISTYPGAG